MKDETARDYAEQIWRVVDYVNANLDRSLDAAHLTKVAGLSKFHFHRQFRGYAGISVSKLVRLLHLKRASYQLVFDPSYPIINIAYDAGFANPESFSRTFKKAQGQTPSQFRANPDWKDGAKQYQFHRGRTPCKSRS
ncbi:MAG: helix-turn-helix transcriptional regulator [Myxococcales bacterium]|nr:helix-turn-helix transcriptional regulator [Myxococcales bacterium]